MSDLHPTDAELELFMLGRLSQRENRRIILHLLPGCPPCREVTSAFWEIGLNARESWPGSERFQYDPTVSRVFDNIRIVRAGLEGERAAAPQLLAELERLPASRWMAMVQADPRFHTWGFCELLIERDSEVCLRLALTAAARIDAAIHPAAFLEELRSRVWAGLAELRRRAGDLDGAEEALRKAESHLLQGGGDRRLERARLLECKAALRHAQELPGEAARLLSRAILLYRRTGQWDQVGRVLIGLGHMQAAAGASVAAAGGRRWLLLDLVRGVTSRVVSRLGR